ncbi:MAG: response regulator [Gammaproteobacteria bacterium]|nr:MAG: response regulator [Gammaproteobacteria bacterium]
MAKKILIIEDDPDIVKLIACKLESAGFEVIIAPDAILGINAIFNKKPDVILLDLILPAGGGLAVIDSMMQSMHTNRIPIIVTTSIEDEEYKRKVLEKGAAAFIQKPYTISQVLTEINRVCL